MGKAVTPQDTAPTLAQHCSSTSRADARAGLFKSTAKSQLGVNLASSSDLLMTWFSDVNYGGSTTDIYGGAGTCDTAGYKITPNSWWQTHLSSSAGFGQCNIARFYARSLTYAESHLLPDHWIGNTLNDNVGMIQVYHHN